MGEFDIDNLAALLLDDPQTGERLSVVAGPEANGDGSYCLTIGTSSGHKLWKHTIKTEEV
jgi:hypothetical protein